MRPAGIRLRRCNVRGRQQGRGTGRPGHWRARRSRCLLSEKKHVRGDNGSDIGPAFDAPDDVAIFTEHAYMRFPRVCGDVQGTFPRQRRQGSRSGGAPLGRFNPARARNASWLVWKGMSMAGIFLTSLRVPGAHRQPCLTYRLLARCNGQYYALPARLASASLPFGDKAIRRHPIVTLAAPARSQIPT